ncbi:MAG: hypothetical protein GYA66_03315 [Phyllobacteriaceae bacterium]|nr:hypothetical protein [Phyllobacteriaceae bacterium]
MTNSSPRVAILPLAAAAVWITASEFLRNEILFKSYWTGHFSGLGLQFATTPVNGALWVAWSVSLALVLQQLLGRFSVRSAVALAWLAAFPMMWFALFNLQVLPVSLLAFAVPLSLLEVVVAAFIIRKLT